MLIVTVLRSKGDSVVTVPPTRLSVTCSATLAEHRIGAVVVSAGDGIAGIVSERDVVRHLRAAGAAILDRPVARDHDHRCRHVSTRDAGRRAHAAR